VGAIWLASTGRVMAGQLTEKKWLSVDPILFTADGNTGGLGHVTVTNAKQFRVKQLVNIQSNTLQPVALQVKRVISETVLLVGLAKTPINKGHDISGYLVADGATISSVEQDRPGITEVDHERATYDEEPRVAKRVILVDSLGRYFEVDNPMPVRLSDGSINIGTVNADVDVQLTDKESAPGENDYDIVRIGNGVYELEILPDGSLPVTVSGGAIKTPTILNIPVVNPGTEYNVVLPAATKRFHLKNRGIGKLQISFVTGETNTNFFELAPKVAYTEEGLSLDTSLTIYFQSTKANEIVELITWE
jgi:hypothetical protein